MTKRSIWVLAVGALALCVLLLRPKEAVKTSFLLAEGRPGETECYILDSGHAGPTVFLLAGTHGNETAGYKAAEQLLERLRPKTGRAVLVPHANKQAILIEKRTGEDGVDMNRAYPGSADGDPIQVLTAQIMGAIRKYDPVCVVDMHEGKDFYGMNESIGNSIVVGQTQGSFEHVLDILEMVNTPNDDLPDFVYEGNAPEGSLNCTVSRDLGIDAFTVETSRKLPLETRVSQQLRIVTSILTQYGMKFDIESE